MRKKSEAYWKQKLTPEQYRILRERGTETPFTGALLRHKDTGIYPCAACGTPLAYRPKGSLARAADGVNVDDTYEAWSPENA